VQDEPRIQYEALGAIAPATRNPKRHDVPTLISSFERFGFVTPLVRDEATERLVAGHGRIEALVVMKEKGSEPPRRIRIDDAGEWLVPVLCGVSFDSEREAEAYLIADNKIVERGWWDDVGLAAMLGDLNEDEGDLERALSGTGIEVFQAMELLGSDGSGGDGSGDGDGFAGSAGGKTKTTAEILIRVDRKKADAEDFKEALRVFCETFGVHYRIRGA
jgi:hypothetical protein